MIKNKFEELLCQNYTKLNKGYRKFKLLLMNQVVHFDIASKVNQLKELEEKINEPDFWNDQNKALKVVNEKNELDNIVNSYFFVQTKLKDISDTYEMIKDLYDEELHALICEELLLIEEKLKEFEIATLLSNEFDTLDAIIEIHPGAGGTESQDWADMLYRMYIRYAEAHNYKINIFFLFYFILYF